MDHKNQITERFRAGPDLGDFRDYLPPRPSLAQQIAAIEGVWALEARMFGVKLGIEVQKEVGGTIRTRRFRYDLPALEVDGDNGVARWVVNCYWEDAIHIEEFVNGGPDARMERGQIQVGDAIKTPLRRVLIPEFPAWIFPSVDGATGGLGDGNPIWWALDKDIGVLSIAVGTLREAMRKTLGILRS